MARVLKGSHGFTCTPRVHPLTEWTIPAFAFPAEAGTHLPTPEGWKTDWLSWPWVAAVGYIPKQMSGTGNWTRTRSSISVLTGPDVDETSDILMTGRRADRPSERLESVCLKKLSSKIERLQHTSCGLHTTKLQNRRRGRDRVKDLTSLLVQQNHLPALALTSQPAPAPAPDVAIDEA